MKSIRLIPTIFFFFGSFIGFGQPTIELAQYKFNHITGAEYSFMVEDFTDISRLELTVTFDGNVISPTVTPFYPNNNFGATWDAIIYSDSVIITMISSDPNGLTLPDVGRNIFITDFQFNGDCNQGSAVKISNSSKVYRKIGEQDIEIGFFPVEGYYLVECPDSEFIETNRNFNICGGTSYEGYDETGTYIDIFDTNTGEDSIRILELRVEPFDTLICPNDTTIFVPAGFDHISLAESGFFPLVRPTACWSLVTIENNGLPASRGNVVEMGTSDLNYRYENVDRQETCRYAIHIVESPTAPDLLSLRMQDAVRQKGEQFTVDVTVEHFKAIVGLQLFFDWDDTVLDFVEVVYSPKIAADVADNQIAPNSLSMVWFSRSLTAIDLADDEVLLSLTFVAKEAGTSTINYFTKNDERRSYVEFVSETNNFGAINALLKNATITVEETICDTIVTNISASVCQGQNYIYNNQAYNRSGTYQIPLTAANGCDSIINLELTVLPPPIGELSVKIEEGEDYTINNQVYNQSGTYEIPLKTVDGCDSILILELMVLDKRIIRTTNTRTICEGTNYEGYSQTGTYVDEFKTDSTFTIRTINLTVEPFELLTCPPNDTFIIPNGFTDIVLTERFSFNIPSSPNDPDIRPTSCNASLDVTETGVPRNNNVFHIGSTNFIYTVQNEVVDTACTRTIHVAEGTPTERLPNFAMNEVTVFKDSIFCIDVTANNFNRVFGLTLKANWDGAAMEYIEMLFPDIYAGNDPLSGTSESNNVAIYNWFASDFVNGYTIPDNTVIYSLCFEAKKTGQFPIEFFNAPGLNLSINEIVLDNGNGPGVSEMWLKKGMVTVLENDGCNTVMTTENATICQGENYILNNQAYNQTGTYEATFTTTNGCDSIVTLNLSVEAIPIANTDAYTIQEGEMLTFDVTQNDQLPDNIIWRTLLATVPNVGTLEHLENGQYRYQPRIGYTGQVSFNYQICNELCLPDGCTDASVTINIEGNNLGVGTTQQPTPTQIPTPIESSRIQQPIEAGVLRIYNIWGQEVENRSFFNDSDQQLRTLQRQVLPVGIYFYVKSAIGTNTILESGKIIAIGR